MPFLNGSRVCRDNHLSRFARFSAAPFWAALLLLAAGTANAQDDDAALETKVRNIALAIGNAYACTAPENREVFKEEAHHLFDLIIQDAGSDLAFVYATSLGYGSSLPKEALDCPASLEQWEGIREDYELKGEE